MKRRLFLKNTLTSGAGILLASCGVKTKEEKKVNPQNADGLKSEKVTADNSKSPKPNLTQGSKEKDIDFSLEGGMPLEKTFGEELGGRRYLNLTKLTENRILTSNENFYIRTRAPKDLPSQKNWQIKIHGMVGNPNSLSVDQLLSMITDQGSVVMECAGNDPGGNFGLISCAKWKGVLLRDLLPMIRITSQPKMDAKRILISGVDPKKFNEKDPAQSIPGADWLFTEQQLIDSGAFFATHMNDKPLSLDHGAPIRLVVPNWYGCVNIKWVNEIKYVPEMGRATQHMKEFMGRIHNNMTPTGDYSEALMDLSATPVRLEKWKVANEIVYKLVGIMWGGKKKSAPLMIKIDKDWEEVDIDFLRETKNGWSLWSYVWVPQVKGRYDISLKIGDPHVRTRRLDMNYYSRTVTISEI